VLEVTFRRGKYVRVLYVETLSDQVEILSPLHAATLSQCGVNRSNCAS
jgi:hypothetical protein